MLRCLLNAQTVTGKITDQLGLPVPYSPVALLHLKDSSVYKGSITNDSGVFIFKELDPGAYLLKTDIPGYKMFYSPSFSLDSLSDKTISTIKLQSSGIDLNEISVSTVKKAVEFKNGNITVNIEDSPLATGNTAYDLLMRLPGVSVDQVNNTVSIQGREGVKMVIDGRIQQLSGRQLMNLLKGLSASVIEKIEVFKNPPIEYDAAGTAGMINIVTKKVKLYGTSGNINTGGSQGAYARGESGFSLNYKARKVTVFSNFNSEYGNYQYVNKFNRRVVYDDVVTSLDQQHTQLDFERGFEANAGLDWFTNDKTIIGFKITAGAGKDNSKLLGNMFLSDSLTGYDQLKYDLNAPDAWQYSNYNVNMERTLDTSGSKIKFSADYNPNPETETRNFNNHFLTGDRETMAAAVFRAIDRETTALLSSKLDLEKKIKKGLEIKSGLKFTEQNLSRNYDLENCNSASDNYIKDTALSYSYKYQEIVEAAYAQLDEKIRWFNIQLGLRAENTHVQASTIGGKLDVTRNYFNLFPLASIDFKANDKHNVQISYNQRINRPNAYAFIPYNYFWLNKLSSDLGNPNVKPEYSNTIELTHTFLDAFSNSIAYSRISNYLMDYTLQNDSTKAILGYITNVGSSTILGYTFFFEAELKNWWSISGNLMATYNTYSGRVNGLDYSSSGFGYSGLVSNIFLLSKSLKLEVEAQYIGPRPLGVFTIQPKWCINLAIKKSFFDEKLDLSIGVNDPTYTFIGRNKVNFQNQSWKISETFDSRRVKISLSYNFGKVKVEQRETASNEEERSKLKH